MGRTMREKALLVGGGLAGLILVLVGYFLLISPQKSQTNSVHAQVASAQQRSAAALARIVTLRQQNANLAKYEADLQQAKLALPDTSGLPEFLRTLQSIGTATQARVTSLTVGVPSVPAPGSATSGTATGSSTTAPTTTGNGSTNAGSKTVYTMPVTAIVGGPAQRLVDFLAQLQTVQPRAVLINTLSMLGGKTDADTTLTVTFNVFVQPSTAAERAQLAAAAQR
ncbi:MAG: hypothetical protein QOG80_1916 [Pseudonocardiales bacterium]|jgi:hypothetical protein|nr:hypothetical protein [Pseudonocardiales bacterium]